jgi:hypothetical protein
MNNSTWYYLGCIEWTSLAQRGRDSAADTANYRPTRLENPHLKSFRAKGWTYRTAMSCANSSTKFMRAHPITARSA